MGRAFITDVHCHPTNFRSLRAFQRKFKGAYVVKGGDVVQGGDEPIVSALHFDRVMQALIYQIKALEQDLGCFLE